MNAPQEGYVLVPGGAVWYRLLEGEGIPLLVVHGGPAAGSKYLAPLADLAPERTVVFYDQLGCGRSQRPSDPSLWRIERFVDELQRLRDALELETVHVFGHSWGGWVTIEHVLTHGEGIAGLVLASTTASIPEYVREVERLVEALPPAAVAALRGDHQTDDYRAGLLEFYARHLCRLPSWPSELVESVRAVNGSEAYLTLQGPNELVVSGSLQTWDRTSRLDEIAVPTLVTVGRYDEATPAAAETLVRGIADAELRVFDSSAHVPHLEERLAYLAAVRAFLSRADAAWANGVAGEAAR